METELSKFTKLKEDLRSLENRKIRIEEQLKSKKQDLQELVLKIKESGYDPKKLNEIIVEKEKALKEQIQNFETKLQKASTQLTAIEV